MNVFHAYNPLFTEKILSEESHSGNFCEVLQRKERWGKLPGAYQRLPLGIFKHTGDKHKEVHQGPDSQATESNQIQNTCPNFTNIETVG